MGRSSRRLHIWTFVNNMESLDNFTPEIIKKIRNRIYSRERRIEKIENEIRYLRKLLKEK